MIRPSEAQLDLPAPPSTNQLYRNWSQAEKARGAHLRKDGKQKAGRPRSERYMTWLNAAGWDLKIQKPAKIKGPVHLTLLLNEAKRLDLSNSLKAVEDLLVEHQVIEGDDARFVRSISLEWARDIPNGVRVIVTPKREKQAITRKAA